MTVASFPPLQTTLSTFPKSLERRLAPFWVLSSSEILKIMEWSSLTKFHPNKLVPAPEGVAWGGTLLMVGPGWLPKPVGPDEQALCGEAGRFGQGLLSPA